jgi:glycosyltransferase involved in cell wall biosynthesis
MNILVSNHYLDSIGGSETFTFTIIEELVRLGHKVEYFTFTKGFVSSKIEKDLGVFFMSHNNYDLILANHNTTVEELYRKGFIIQTCHGIYPSLEQPSSKADAYVAISEEVQNHLAIRDCPSYLIHNSINLERFKPENKINKDLKNVLSLCHSDSANNFIEDICAELSLNFSKAYKYKNPVWSIEKEINRADMVIGLGRSAFEAMACGRPVIVFDNRKYFKSYGDGYIKDSIALSLKNNCSGRYSKNEYNKDKMVAEFNKYSASDSEFFRFFAQKEFDVTKNITKYFHFYDELIKTRKKAKRAKKIKIAKKILGSNNFNNLAKAYKGKKKSG